MPIPSHSSKTTHARTLPPFSPQSYSYSHYGTRSIPLSHSHSIFLPLFPGITFRVQISLFYHHAPASTRCSTVAKQSHFRPKLPAAKITLGHLQNYRRAGILALHPWKMLLKAVETQWRLRPNTRPQSKLYE